MIDCDTEELISEEQIAAQDEFLKQLFEEEHELSLNTIEIE